MVDAVKGMGKEGADVLVRPTPKHYKCYKNKAKLIPIKEMLRCAKQQQLEGANTACVYPSLIEFEANSAIQDQRLESQVLQANQPAKPQPLQEEITNEELIVGRGAKTGGMQDKLIMPCMHEAKPEFGQSPINDNEIEQQQTAAAAIV